MTLKENAGLPVHTVATAGPEGKLVDDPAPLQGAAATMGILMVVNALCMLVTAAFIGKLVDRSATSSRS